jgi:hypothetical protein
MIKAAIPSVNGFFIRNPVRKKTKIFSGLTNNTASNAGGI